MYTTNHFFFFTLKHFTTRYRFRITLHSIPVDLSDINAYLLILNWVLAGRDLIQFNDLHAYRYWTRRRRQYRPYIDPPLQCFRYNTHARSVACGFQKLLLPDSRIYRWIRVDIVIRVVGRHLERNYWIKLLPILTLVETDEQLKENIEFMFLWRFSMKQIDLIILFVLHFIYLFLFRVNFSWSTLCPNVTVSSSIEQKYHLVNSTLFSFLEKIFQARVT